MSKIKGKVNDSHSNLNKMDEELDAINEDYGFALQDEEISNWAENACGTISNLLPMFSKVRIVMAKLESGILGKFRSETESCPIILLCPKNIKRECKKQKVGLELAVATTVYHEIGHAFYALAQDSGADLPEDEEWFAEEFARSIWESGCLSYIAEEILKSWRS